MYRRTTEDGEYAGTNADSRTSNDEFSRPVRGIELMTRHSIYSIASMGTERSDDRTQQQHHKWNLKDLRDQFERDDELLHLYKKYQTRLMTSVHLQSYLLLQIIINTLLILLILLVNLSDELQAIPELIANVVQLAMASLTFWYMWRGRARYMKIENNIPQRMSDGGRLSNDKPAERDGRAEQGQTAANDNNNEANSAKFELALLTAVIMFFLVGVDLALGVWFLTQNRQSDAQGSVFYIGETLYALLVVYNFLPIRSLRYTVSLGLLISTAHVSFVVLAFYKDTFDQSTDVPLIIAETVFYCGINLMGIFMKTLNETTLRRAFLDKRKCIETTLKLNYEKTQEEKLMLSILPEHIASKVSQDIWDEVRALEEESETKTQAISHKPFNNLYVETHQEVSILYADIVNFTPLTASLHPAHLVQMLNELFGKFDKAAQDNDCLRIKILGDCYYCVSGICRDSELPADNQSNKNHAKNCVEMGFRMIDIIRDVREDYRVNVDMRIGIHTGSVISGLLGFRKWQYDIWSRDVTIANHMEQSGQPGRVHISMTTRALLEDAYEYDEGHGRERDSYLRQNDIKTFLVKRNSPEDTIGKAEQRKIKFLTPEQVRAQFPDTDGAVDTTDEEPSLDNRDYDELSLSSLYEVLPEPPPVMITQPRTSGSHTNSTLRGLPQALKEQFMQKTHKPSNAISELDQHQEIYSRFYKGPRRKSGPVSGTQKEIVKRRSTATNNDNLRRGAVWMDTALRDVMTKANEAMEDAIQNMQLSKFKQGGKSERSKVNFLLLFKDKSWELPFLLRPDFLFGTYIIGAVPAILAILIMQFILYSESVPEQFWWTLGFASISFFVAAAILWGPILWRWFQICRYRIREWTSSFRSQVHLSQENTSAFSDIEPSAFYLKMSRFKRSFWCRIVIFFIVCASIGIFSMSSMYVTASNQPGISNGTFSACHYRDSRIYIWYFTYSCALAMTVVFGFYRINFYIKLAVYTVITVVYSVLLYKLYPQICANFVNREECLRCMPSLAMSPELTHVMYLLQILLVLHVADRQIEFIHRLDFIWQKQLISEQKQAYTTRTVNKLLLHNILPLHVAEIYLDRHHPKGLYHEDYEAVAVMFASIPSYMDNFANNDSGDGGLRSLEILNEIISGFDALLYSPPFQLIEKIKIVSSTYMAACGLKAIKKNVEDSEEFDSYSNEDSFKSLFTMVYFAVAMEKFLEQYSLRTRRKFKLRIGISYGPVVAGVVGAEKPLYDIWGDTVNMASRLEYTGDLGKIHVTEDVAMYLENVGIPNSTRGETFLKGKGNVRTCWIHPQHVSLNGVISMPRPSNVSVLYAPMAERRPRESLRNGRRITEEKTVAFLDVPQERTENNYECSKNG